MSPFDETEDNWAEQATKRIWSTVMDKINIDKKDLNGKPNPLRMPYEALVAYSQVSDNGNDKYGNRDSWKYSTNGVEVYSNAAARHLFQAMINPVDEESGLLHLKHALWSIVAALWHYENKQGFLYQQAQQAQNIMQHKPGDIVHGV